MSTTQENTPARKLQYRPEPLPRVAPRAGAANTRRTGIIPLCIGASRMLRGSDGVRRQYEARELAVEAARAQRDGRTLNVVYTCFECGRMYHTEEEFRADHAASTQSMKDNDESHTWAFWCEDRYDPKGVENSETLAVEIKALKTAHKTRLAEIAQAKDVEAMMKLRESAEKIKAMILEAETKKAFEDQNIIGLLSETPYAS